MMTFSACRIAYYVIMTSSSDNCELVYNARIWQSTGDDMTWMAFSADSGYVTAVGRHDPPLDKFPPTRRRDVGGRRVIPGLHDSHIHVTYLGRQLHCVDLKGCQSVEQLQQRVRRFAAERPGATWIVGHGWEQHLLGRLPTRHDVDAACCDRPVHLIRMCGHASVENTLALKLAGFIFCLSNAMVQCYARIEYKFTCVCLSVCVCVRHTFCQLAYWSDPSTDYYS